MKCSWVEEWELGKETKWEKFNYKLDVHSYILPVIGLLFHNDSFPQGKY